jgi:DDE superfamily endonuclease
VAKSKNKLGAGPVAFDFAALRSGRTELGATASEEVYESRVVRFSKGEHPYLWWAVDQAGTVLGILVQSRWDQKAATKFFRKLLTGLR